MTPLFDQFIKTIKEESSFANLPSSPPYGFWIAPNGDFFPVPREQHQSVGYRILRDKPELQSEYQTLGNHASINEFLYKKRYIRTVKEGNIIHYNYEIMPNRYQMETLHDLGHFYKMELKKA